MLGPSRRRLGSSLPYRIPLWGALLVVGAVLYFDAAPMLLDPSPKVAEGERIARTRPSDIVCVLDYRQIANSPSGFRKRDWSAAWVDMLEQHVGPVTVVTPKSLRKVHLEGASAIVLTASVSDTIPAPMVERLREYALGGDLIVAERPTGKLREMFAANGEAGLQVAHSVTFADGIDEPYRSQLEALPLDTQYVGSTAPKENAETLMAIDGAPAIYAAPVGEGTVVTVEFDLGQQLVALQQGRPSAAFRVGEGDESGERPPRTDALVADAKLRGATVPYADLLERFMLRGILQRYAPFPTLWPFPGDASGVVVPVHEDRTLGDRGGWMLEYETSRNASSTLLSSVDAGLTASGAAVIDRRGGEIGLLWRRAESPARRTEAYGLWGFEPVARPVGLGDQLGALAETLPGASVTSAKSAGRWWSREWAEPFRQLAHHGVPLDLSYEPRERGFAFGTGFPFRTLDRTGLPLPVRELPVVVPGRSSEEFGLEKLLEASRGGHHQVITYSLAPSSFGRYPDMRRFEQWLESFREIRRNAHTILSARELLGFWRGRLGSRLESEVIREVVVPEGETDEEELEATRGSGEGVLLRVEAKLERNDLSIVVPESFGGREFDQARRRMSRVAGSLVAKKLDTRPESLVGFDVRRIPLESGSSRIDVYYR